MPKDHPLTVTVLIVESYHVKYLHTNHLTVLNELKQVYVIPSLRAKLKTIRSRFMKCRIRNARPEVPEMADLPNSRLAARIHPFTYVGIDLY